MSRVNTENHLYRYFDADDKLLYVGISVDALRRLNQHYKNAKWFTRIAKITIEKFPNRKAVSQAEVKAIQAEKPKYNIQHAIGSSNNILDDLFQNKFNLDINSTGKRFYSRSEIRKILGLSNSRISIDEVLKTYGFNLTAQTGVWGFNIAKLQEVEKKLDIHKRYPNNITEWMLSFLQGEYNLGVSLNQELIPRLSSDYYRMYILWCDQTEIGNCDRCSNTKLGIYFNSIGYKRSRTKYGNLWVLGTLKSAIGKFEKSENIQVILNNS